MKSPLSLAGLLFGCIQCLGIVCMLSWESAPSVTRFWLWAAGLLSLFPGNVLGSALIQKLLWETSISNPFMSSIGIALAVVINAMSWLVLFAGIMAVSRFTHRAEWRTRQGAKN